MHAYIYINDISHLIPKHIFAQTSISLTFGFVFEYVQFAANNKWNHSIDFSKCSPFEVPLTCKCLKWNELFLIGLLQFVKIADSGGIWFLSQLPNLCSSLLTNFLLNTTVNWMLDCYLTSLDDTMILLWIKVTFLRFCLFFVVVTSWNFRLWLPTLWICAMCCKALSIASLTLTSLSQHEALLRSHSHVKLLNWTGSY